MKEKACVHLQIFLYYVLLIWHVLPFTSIYPKETLNYRLSATSSMKYLLTEAALIIFSVEVMNFYCSFSYVQTSIELVLSYSDC